MTSFFQTNFGTNVSQIDELLDDFLTPLHESNQINEINSKSKNNSMGLMYTYNDGLSFCESISNS